MPQSITGFVLTRHWLVRDQQQILRLWIKHEQGCEPLDIHHEPVVCFVRQSDSEQVAKILGKRDYQLKPLQLQSFTLEPVSGLYFSHWQALKSAVRDLAKHAIPVWEDDINPVDRYLMERFITAGVVARQVSGQGTGVSNGELADSEVKKEIPWQLKSHDYRPKLVSVSLDIETSPFFPNKVPDLYSIALASDHSDPTLQNWVGIVGHKNVRAPKPNCEVECFDHTQDLLVRFLEKFNQIDPDLILGWAIVGFDLRILQQHCDRFDLAFAIGRQNTEPRWRQQDDDRWRMEIEGRVVLDGPETLRTAFYFFDSYSLENVSRELLGRGKLVHNSENRLQEIIDMYQQRPDDLVAYNLEDCQLVLDIFEQKHLVPFLIERAFLTGHSLDRIGGSAAAFNYLYLPRLHRQGFVSPNVGSQTLTFHSPGGYVMDSTPGLYEHVLVLDFKSLYPSIIRTFFVDPLGMIRALNGLSQETLEGFDGGEFDRQVHILPALIDQLWQARDEAKHHKDEPLSQAIKIIMNSFYGVLGSNLCRFYDPRLSSSITKRGHEIMIESRRWIEAQGYQVIYGDTDSTFVWLQKNVTREQANKIGQQLKSGLNAMWQKKLMDQYGIVSQLEMEFETHYRHFLMPTIRGSETGSKKRYAGLIETESGEEKIVFKGLESVRSDWTELAKHFQQELYHRIFHHLPVGEFIQDQVAQLRSGQLDEQLVFRRRLRKPLSHYTKNVPPHAQAAKLRKQYQPDNHSNRIEYVMTVNGVEPLGWEKSPLDYEFYLERQLKPVADAALQFLNASFDDYVSQQFNLL